MGGCLSYRLKLVSGQVPMEDTLFRKVTHFSFKSLKNATNNFSTSNVIRESGFRKHYKGKLEDGSVVTIVVYSSQIHGDFDVTSMIKIMSGVKHHNVVELIGYCIEDDRKMLVLEFVGDYTLYQLFSDHYTVGDVVLDWPRRVSICRGFALALDYLHNGISPRVVHGDVKPSSFFIDHSFNPKITDFELSCLLQDAESLHSVTDPDYLRPVRYPEKTDVYAFGITLLEIISGKSSVDFLRDHGGTSLVDWTWELQERGRISDIVDPSLSEYSENEVTRFVIVALSCAHLHPKLRPNMSEVRLMLSDRYDFTKVVLTRPERPDFSPQFSSVDEPMDNLSN